MPTPTPITIPTPATSAAASPLRNPPADCIELIKAFEGIPDGDPRTVNIDAYLCPAGVWTIGWGHALMDGAQQLCGPANLPRARALYPGGITRTQAELLLKADLLPRCAAVCSVVKRPLNDGMLGALLAFVFNVGAANFGASSLLRLLNQGDLAGAADQFLRWDKARVNGVLQSLAGLTRRRKAERAMFLGQDWRAAGQVQAPSRSRSRTVERQLPLPVPEPPDDQQSPAEPVALSSGSVEPTTAARAPRAATPGLAIKAGRTTRTAVKPRGQTTKSTDPLPKPPAKRPIRPASR